MPFGVLLDSFVYPNDVRYFLGLRLGCSAMLACMLPLFSTQFARRYHRVLGLAIALLPAFFICWMIYKTKVAPLLRRLEFDFACHCIRARWDAGSACGGKHHHNRVFGGRPGHSWPRRPDLSELVNNLYFLGLTGVIVVTGSKIHRRLRLREAALSRELKRSNEELGRTIEKLQATQDQLVESEKKRALGVLAGGIIHDIGNTLNHINTNLFVLRKRCAQPNGADKLSAILLDLEQGTKQALNTVQRVRLYTHPNTDYKEAVSVREVVEAAVTFTAFRWKDAEIEIRQDVEETQTILGNRHNLIDVVANLVLNSVDALKTKRPEETPTVWIEAGFTTEEHSSRPR
jgi:hypothetical protein